MPAGTARCCTLLHLDAASRAGLHAQPAAVALVVIYDKTPVDQLASVEVATIHAKATVAAQLLVGGFTKGALVAEFLRIPEVVAAFGAAEADAIQLLRVFDIPERSSDQALVVGLG